MEENPIIRGKRLLILGGAIQCLKVVEAAKALGVYTIVTDISAAPQTAAAADECLPYSVMDVEALYQWCMAHPVDGVLNYCVDPAQITHQRLCQRLGLPCYGTAEQYRVLTDKTAFKAFCQAHGVDTIPAYDEGDRQGIRYPVLVKPAESSGSRGASVCADGAELEAAIQAAKVYSRNGKVILEQYMGDKQDFTVTFLCVHGEPCLIRIGDRYLGKEEDGLHRQCIGTVCPSSHTNIYFSNVHDRAVGMLKALGLQNGPVFLQGFLDGDTVRFYDPGIRFPGGEYDRLLREATGIDTMQIMVSYALTGAIRVPETVLRDAYRLNGRTAVQLTVTARNGKIAVYDGLDVIRRMQGVVCVAPKSSVGAVIPASGDLKQRVAEIAFLAESYVSSGKTAAEIYGRLRILDETGKDMVVSRFAPTDP